MKKLLTLVLVACASWLVMQSGTSNVYAAGGTCDVNTANQISSNNCDSGYTATLVNNPPNEWGISSTSCQCLPTGTSLNTCQMNLAKNVTADNCGSGSSPAYDANSSTLCRCSASTNTTAVAKCIDTDLGCIPTDPRGLANAILNVIFGIAGAVATILIIIGGFKVAGSQGNVEALEDGRDMITKAITGLVFILLASVILSIIGLDILGLNFAFGPTGVFPINR